jgi:hypothetical protein
MRILDSLHRCQLLHDGYQLIGNSSVKDLFLFHQTFILTLVVLIIRFYFLILVVFAENQESRNVNIRNCIADERRYEKESNLRQTFIPRHRRSDSFLVSLRIVFRVGDTTLCQGLYN